ncbi:MAG: hypothetical protein WCI04_06355 [archaeon]
MLPAFSLTDEQRKAFENLISNPSKASESLSKQEVIFDAFSALAGSEKVLVEIKSKIPFSFSGTALFVCDASNSKDVLLALTKFCSLAGFTPVLVLFGSNFSTISKSVRDSGFLGRFLILDCVSKSIAQVNESDNVIFVDSMRNLTQMQIKVLNIIEKNPKCAFIFDSLQVLSLYHSEDVVLKFVYSISKLFRTKNTPAHFITNQKKSMLKFSQFFDESIELKKFY